MSHTPGPWEWVREEEVSAWSLAPGVLLTDYTDGTPDGDGIDRANARLIAAAPDLLLACQRLRAHISLLDLDEMPSHMIDELRDASAAIAKAEGK